MSVKGQLLKQYGDNPPAMFTVKVNGLECRYDHVKTVHSKQELNKFRFKHQCGDIDKKAQQNFKSLIMQQMRCRKKRTCPFALLAWRPKSYMVRILSEHNHDVLPEAVLLINQTFCDPVPIDLAEQHGKFNHHGHGDVVELWEKNQNNTKMRNALRSTAQNRWTVYRDPVDARFVIPYIVSGQFKEEDRQTIQEAMDKIERNTCLKFRPRRAEKDFVDIQNEYGEGCYTNVGRIPGRNVLMLEAAGDETCVTNGTVLHELMHKIGLWHEQMRQDRDAYIEVLLENIPFYLHAQFRKVGATVATNHGVRYDYRSLMHYGPHAFASPHDALSMRTKSARFQDVIGTAKDASRGDYIKICAIYACPVCMGEKFDAQKAALEFQQQIDDSEETSSNNVDVKDASVQQRETAAFAFSTDCTPLVICDTELLTKSSNPTLYKIGCCEPCSECRPEPICAQPHVVKHFPHIYKYDCCGRCE